MQPPSSSAIRTDFERLVERKFAQARLLVVGTDSARFISRRKNGTIPSTQCTGIVELDALQKTDKTARFDLAIWFYPAEPQAVDDSPILDRLTAMTDNLVLVPAAGVNLAQRRPSLVMALAQRSFFPDYDCEIVESEPGAVRLSRKSTDELSLPEVEAGFARINAQWRGMHRTLRTRLAELEAADRHIAQLEEKVLKLKEAKRDLKQLKAEKQALRKSPERKLGQIILAPYRLPQKLIREVWILCPK